MSTTPHTEVTRSEVGSHDDETIIRFVLEKPHGLRMALLNYGATLQELHVPDAQGVTANVVLGFDNAQQYQHKHPHFGATIGRYANRIGGCEFTLDGETYELTPNKVTHTAHGGEKPFDKYVWASEEVATVNGPGVRFTHVSPDGDEGFPGEFTVSVTYSLTCDNGLQLDYEASTTKPTVQNLTNHSYFNLGGEDAGVIDDHVMTINAKHYTPTDRNQIPTGDFAPVRGTVFDFTKPRAIGNSLRAGDDPQIRIGCGIDHNFVINRAGNGEDLVQAAEIYDPDSRRLMTVFTTLPGVQVYTGNHLDGTIMGYSGTLYRQSDAVCFETQSFPDSPNHSEFPSTVLRPGEVFKSTTVYQFGIHTDE